MYGLAAVDPEPNDRARLQSLIIKHVRAMAKSFAHMHYESSCKVLLRCGVLSAQDQLQKETEGLLRRLQTHADTTPLVSTSHLEALRAQAANLQAADLTQVNAITQSIGEEFGHSCHECGRTFRSFRLLRSHEAKWHQLKTPNPQQTVFDRYEHGTDGLPTCRHCGHRFRQWANLKQHIQQNRCQILRTKSTPGDSSSRLTNETKDERGAQVAEEEGPPKELNGARQAELSQTHVQEAGLPRPGGTASPEEDDRESATQEQAEVSTTASHGLTSTKSIPLQDWPLVKQTLQAGSWTELLECAEVQAYLQHYCPICMQWAATPNGLKCHMTNQHEEWKQLQKPIQHLLLSFRRHTVLPCRYCKQSRVNKDRHWQQCHVLSFCAFLRVRYDVQSSGRHGSGRSGAALLPALGATIRSTSRLSRPQSSGLQQSSSELGGCKETESGGSGEKQGQRRKRKGQSQGEGRASSRPRPGPGHLSLGKNVGIQQWLQRGPSAADAVDNRLPRAPRLDGGENGPTHTDGPPPGADLVCSQTRPDAVLVCPERRAGHDPHLVPGGRKMESYQGGGAGETGIFSLKLAMFKQLMITLQERLTETSKSQQAMDHAKSLNWVDQEGCWRILKWNGTKQSLEIDTTIQPTSTENLLTQIVQVRKAITETSLIRFKSIRSLTEGVQTEWVTFQIFVSLRQEGSPIWSSLTSWIGPSCISHDRCRLRRDRPQYDALAASLWG